MVCILFSWPRIIQRYVERKSSEYWLKKVIPQARRKSISVTAVAGRDRKWNIYLRPAKLVMQGGQMQSWSACDGSEGLDWKGGKVVLSRGCGNSLKNEKSRSWQVEREAMTIFTRGVYRERWLDGVDYQKYQKMQDGWKEGHWVYLWNFFVILVKSLAWGFLKVLWKRCSSNPVNAFTALDISLKLLWVFERYKRWPSFYQNGFLMVKKNTWTETC